MKDFTLLEFNAIWNQLKDHVTRNYNIGRGSKSPGKAKDLVFLLMAVLKHGAKWDLMAYLFGIKYATFEKRVSHIVKTLADFMYCRFVDYYAERYSMQRLIDDKTVFKSYKMCRYATDVMFQQSCRPGGSLEKVKSIILGSVNFMDIG